MEELEFYENPNCIGTMGYHRTTFLHAFVSTDGVIEMFKTLSCFWIGDVVVSWLPDLKKASLGETFFAVKIIRDQAKGARFTIDDGNGKVLISQNIEYSDLPQNVKLFLVYCDETWVLMLPSEY